jgi:4-hydroxy-tetrahydrodipicolinate synthase
MSLPAAPFGRVLTAMVTPFTSDGGVDLDGVGRVATHLMDHGNDGLVVSGTTGESPTTTVPEDTEILRAVKDAVGDRGSVIAGVGTNSTAHSVELAVQAEKVGADAVLLVVPYYNKPGQAGILHHFTEVARATSLPVMLYDVPGRTGQAIAPSTYEAARRLDNVTSVKHATGNPVDAIALRELGYDVYSGDDALYLGYLAHGACGIVSVASHVLGEELRTMTRQFDAGDHQGALATFAAMLPVIDALMGVPNYGATTAKAAMQLLGVLDNRHVRGPLVPLEDDEVEALRAAIQKAGHL